MLFDIDGTLLLDDAYAHGRAMMQALRCVYGVKLSEDAVQAIQPWGKTDPRIAREVLHAAGLSDEAIDAGLPDWEEAVGSLFLSESAVSAGNWRVRPGLLHGLDRLTRAGMRLTVLTGNLRAIARTKVARMGLAGELDLAIGAYGEDAEERRKLVPIARDRAGSRIGPWPRERTAVVGDTPTDIAAARADFVASAVFLSSRYPESALGAADAVVASIDDLVMTLESWHLRGAPAPGSGVANLVAQHEPE